MEGQEGGLSTWCLIGGKPAVAKGLYLPRGSLTRGHQVKPWQARYILDLPPTCALCDAGRSGSLRGRSGRARCAFAVNGPTTTVVTNWALQHRQETAAGTWVEGVGCIVGTVDHTKTGQDVAIGDDPLLCGGVGGCAARRALLTRLAAALCGVKAWRATRSTCKGSGRHGEVL
jgi:hypothetical protein